MAVDAWTNALIAQLESRSGRVYEALKAFSPGLFASTPQSPERGPSDPAPTTPANPNQGTSMSEQASPEAQPRISPMDAEMIKAALCSSVVEMDVISLGAADVAECLIEALALVNPAVKAP